MFSVTPPRYELVLMRSARCRFGLLILQSRTITLRTPPDDSLPMLTPPCPSFILQFCTIRFSHGLLTRRPSALRPDLIAMQASPVSKVHPSISTSVHDSGSQPSLLGPWLLMLTLRTVTFFDNTG